MTSRSEVVGLAREWLGTPYHHQGRIKGAGVDCATLLCEVYEAAGMVPHVDPTPYPQDWHMHRDSERYLGWIRQYGREVPVPEVGDVIIWRFGRCFSHGAIYIGDGMIIHSYIGQGVRYERVDAEVFRSRPVKYFTLWK